MPVRAGLAFAVMAAILARSWGLDYGLPYSFYPDESDKVMEPIRAIAASGDLRPSHYLYPTFWLYCLALALRLAAGLGPPTADLGPLESPTYVYGTIRAVTAVVGALSVIPLFLVARRILTVFGSPQAHLCALVAAGFLALSPLHVQQSHVASPDVPTTAFLILALYFALRIVDDGRTRWYLLAGLATGLASGAKYPSATFALAIVAAHLARTSPSIRLADSDPRSGIPQRGTLGETGGRQPVQLVSSALVDRRLWLAGLATIASFLATSPFIVLDWPRFRADFASQASRVLSRGPVGDLGSSGPLAPILYVPDVLGWGLDLPVAVLAALGLGWVAWTVTRLAWVHRPEARPARYAAVLLVYPLVTYVFSWSWQDRFARYVVPLVPFACILAGLGLAWLMRALARRSIAAEHVTAIGMAVGVAALLWQADGVVRFDVLLTHPDTRTIAAQWMAPNIPPDQPVLTEWYGPPHSNIRQTGLELADRPLDRYRERGLRYVATSSFVYDRWLRNPERFPRRVAFYRSLDDEARLLLWVAPWPDFGYDPVQEGWQGWHGIPLGSEARPGPHIRVYQLTE